MRVLVSTRSLAKPPTGIGHYTADTVRALRQLPGLQVREFPARWVRPLARYRERHLDWWLGALQPPPPGLSGQRVTHSLVSRLERFFLRQHSKQSWFTPARNDVYLEPNHELMPTSLPTVVVVYDLSVLRFPQWHPEGRVAHHRAFFETLAERGQSLTVVTISEAIRQEAIQSLGLPPDRVITGCCAPRTLMRPGLPSADAPQMARLGLTPGYFLHVGTLEPRKNLALLVRAWSGLDSAIRLAHPLVLAGGQGWGDEAFQDALRQAPAGIHHLGYVDEADIPALYRCALSLVMPTHYEGFGMPVIEMRAVGGAVLTSLDPAVREIAGDDTPGIAADDQAGWTAALDRAAADDNWLAPQRSAGPAWAGRFTWRRGAEAVRDACRVAIVGTSARSGPVAA